CTIFPISIAINIATTPFKISHINVIAAAFFPTDLSILVVPALPLPFSLTSKPAIFLLKITEKFTLPIKYAITAITTHSTIFFLLFIYIYFTFVLYIFINLIARLNLHFSLLLSFLLE